MFVLEIRPVLVVSLAAFVFAGCSSSDGAAPGPTGSAKSGITDCGYTTCQAGSHCEDARDGTCKPGCTTDNNCPGEQQCVAGMCQNGAKRPTTACERVAEADGLCAEAKLPRNAYHCTSTSPPSAECQLFTNQKDYPGGYCCP